MYSMVGDEASDEDKYLTSANLCRWVINYDDIGLQEQIGVGSYGAVFKGKWKGMVVAVKKFLNQKIDERRLLELRTEMAFMSELRHPNVVMLIGANLLLPCRSPLLLPPVPEVF